MKEENLPPKAGRLQLPFYVVLGQVEGECTFTKTSGQLTAGIEPEPEATYSTGLFR
jgi:hypothetical protein